MKRGWIEPLVRAAESWLDESVNRDEYERFVQRSINRLRSALTDPASLPAWAGELELAIENLQRTRIDVGESLGDSATGVFNLPIEAQAVDWLRELGEEEIIFKGSVKRFTATHLLSILQGAEAAQNLDLQPYLDTLLRHIEVRRKACLQLSGSGRPSDRWLEKNETAILMARAARKYSDLRYLNAAMKLIDWALPVHRRSVPADLLARYVLAISEVQLAYEALT